MIEKALSEQLPYVPSREQIRWCYRDFIGFRIKYWGSFDDYFKSQMYRKSDLTRKEWDIVKDIHGNYCVIEDKTHKDASATVNYNLWFGLDATITGSVSSDSEHKRQTDSTTIYQIHARAVHQPPSEGMAKLTSLFAQSMEPIKTDKK